MFNLHEQFRKLRTEGKWERMKASIRKRDAALHGEWNPMLDDFGERSEARQYSGRAVEDSRPPKWDKPVVIPFRISAGMQRVEPQCGIAFQLLKKQLLTVTDLEGKQVADLVAFNAADTREYLSSGRSIDYANMIYLTTSNVLYSNRSRPLLTIVADDVGQHDFLLTPCSPETFQIILGSSGYHPSCFENLAISLKQFGIMPDSISTTFNIFMNVVISPDGTLNIQPPPIANDG